MVCWCIMQNFFLFLGMKIILIFMRSFISFFLRFFCFWLFFIWSWLICVYFIRRKLLLICSKIEHHSNHLFIVLFKLLLVQCLALVKCVFICINSKELPSKKKRRRKKEEILIPCIIWDLVGIISSWVLSFCFFYIDWLEFDRPALEFVCFFFVFFNFLSIYSGLLCSWSSKL